MNLDCNFLFNKSYDDMRSIGRGGRARARNLRLRPKAPAVQVAPPACEETTRQAIERLDTQFPWLRGCELRATRRPTA